MAWINDDGVVEYHSIKEKRIMDEFLLFGTQTTISLNIPSGLRGRRFRLRLEVCE